MICCSSSFAWNPFLSGVTFSWITFNFHSFISWLLFFHLILQLYLLTFVRAGQVEMPLYCVASFIAGNVLCMRPANERWGCIVTASLIGWVLTQNSPCYRPDMKIVKNSSCRKYSGVDEKASSSVEFSIYQWLFTRLQYLQCISNRDTVVL